MGAVGIYGLSVARPVLCWKEQTYSYDWESAGNWGQWVYMYRVWRDRSRAQELCKSRGGPLGLSVLTNLMVSVDVKQY